MTRFERQDQRGLHLAVVAAVTAVFVFDCLTPLGIAVWIFYLVPMVLSFSSWRPRNPLLVAAATTVLVSAGYLLSPTAPGLPLRTVLVNRGMAALTFWVMGVVGRQFIRTRLELREQDWIKSGQRDLAQRLHGEHRLDELAERTLRFLCEYLGAPVGALYVRAADASLRRRAGYALSPDSGRATVAEGEGLLGQAVKDRRLLRAAELPPNYLPVSSALGSGPPQQVIAVPLLAEQDVVGAVEVGFLQRTGRAEADLLSTVAEPVAVAIRSSLYRARLEDLLEQTQRQASELTVQQEELRVNNEELEAQGRSLRESQAHLEEQQAELEETNSRLEEQARVLEEQRAELSRAQVQLVQRADELARANRYKSEFLANMSHELRTPLNSALILSRLLADNREGNLTPEQVRWATTIHSSGNDLLALINDILDLSRVEAGRVEIRPEPVSLQQVLAAVRRTVQPMADQKRLRLAAEVDPSAPASITTDPVRLQQILRNLLSNAVKFTDEGEVSLRVAGREDGQIAFSVRDTGPGISPDQQQVIFEAFRQGDGSTQRRHGGAGLGLTISRELARRLGGDVFVESARGSGSTFTLVLPTVFAIPEAEPLPERPQQATAGRLAPRLPVPAPAQVPPPRAAPAATPQPAGVPDDRATLLPGERSVLVIEDDPAFARILRDLAHEMGFRCLLAATAGEGLRLAEAHLPSAVLLDVELPDGSGLGVLEQLKRQARTRHLPVHVVSVADYTGQALEMGAVGYAVKPVRREQLVEAFEKLQQRLEQKVRRLLVVEDVAAQRESIVALLDSAGVEITAVGCGEEALEKLKAQTFDCMVLDLSLPDMTGYDLLDRMAAGEVFSFPPVIVYTGRELGPEEELRLRRYASSIIVKGARSPERLLDEATLFLHQVEASLPPEQQRILREVRSREAALEGRRILVVEDDVRNVFALTSLLEPKGATLCIARNGREALRALDEAERDPAAGIDLVLMDVMMPEMDGLSAMREIRRRPRWRKLPIIALTAKAMSDDREKCLDAGASDYVAKPLDVDRLLSLVKVWLAR